MRLSTRMRRVATLGAAAWAVGAAIPAMAGFDGRWSVIAETKVGDCDRFRWNVLVSQGKIWNANGPGPTVEGAVDQQGAVRVTLGEGKDAVAVFGQVEGERGRGKWLAANGQCAGAWRARKQAAN